MNTEGYELFHVVWNEMHLIWSTFEMVWNEKKWYVIIPHMEMRIISYRLYTISYQIWYEFFACFFLMEKWTQGGSIGLALVWSKIKKAKICFVIYNAGKRKILFVYLWSDYMGKKKKSLPIVLLIHWAISAWRSTSRLLINGSLRTIIRHPAHV